MSDLKTKPKIKEKPQSAKHIVKNAPKDVKSIPYNVLSNAPSVMKEQLIKRNSEKQLNDNDEQTPENYATDTIEFAAYSTTSKVYRTMRIIADHTKSRLKKIIQFLMFPLNLILQIIYRS